MKRKWKEILAILLAAAMTLQTAPVGAYASESGNAVQAQTASADEPAVSDDSTEEQEISADAAVSDDEQEAAGTVSEDITAEAYKFFYFAFQLKSYSFKTPESVAGVDFVEYDSSRNEISSNTIKNYYSRISGSYISQLSQTGLILSLSPLTKYVRLRVRFAGTGKAPMYSEELVRPEWNSDALKLTSADGGINSLDVTVKSDMFNNDYLWRIFTGQYDISVNAVLYYGKDNDSTKWTASCNGKIKENDQDTGIDYGFAGIPAGTYYGKTVFATSDGKWQQTINLPGSFEICGDSSYRLDEILPDKALRKCVADALSCDDTDTVSQSDLNGVITLECRDKGIVSIDGIGYLKDLQTAILADNSISTLDGTGITGLKKLQCLKIDNNGLKALPDMNSLRSLLSFSAEDNDLTVLPDVSGTKVYNKFDVKYNKIPASEFTSSTVENRLYHGSDEEGFRSAVAETMQQAATQRLGAISVTLPDRMYMCGSSRPLYFEVKNISPHHDKICVSVNGAEQTIDGCSGTVYSIQDTGSTESSNKVCITVKSSSGSTAVEKTVTWLADEPFTERDTYTAAGGDISSMGDINVYSTKTILSADIISADGMVFANAPANYNSYQYDNDMRYSELNGGRGIQSGLEESIFEAYNATYGFTAKYLSLPSGKYSLRIFFKDGSSHIFADKIISKTAACVTGIEPAYDYYNCGGHLYVKVYEKGIDASKLVFSVSDSDGVTYALDTENWKYLSDGCGQYILYRLKKVNWKDNADVQGMTLKVQAADGYDAVFGKDSCEIELDELDAAYNYRNGHVELYCSVLDGQKVMAKLIDRNSTALAACSVSFNNGRASALFMAADGSAYSFAEGRYEVALFDESGEDELTTDSGSFKVKSLRKTGTGSWKGGPYLYLDRGTGIQSLTYNMTEELSGNSSIVLLDLYSGGTVMLSGNAVPEKNEDGSFDYTVSMDMSSLKAGSYFAVFHNVAYESDSKNIYIVDRNCVNLCGMNMTVSDGRLMLKVSTYAPGFDGDMKLSLYDADGVSINSAVFEKISENRADEIVTADYKVSHAGLLRSSYFVKLQPVSGGNAVEVRNIWNGTSTYTASAPLGTSISVWQYENRPGYSLLKSDGIVCSGIRIDDRAVLPAEITVTKPDETDALITYRVTKNDVKAEGSYYTFTFPESIVAALPDRNDLYALYVTDGSGQTEEISELVSLGAASIPARGITLDNQSLALKLYSTVKLNVSLVPAYADPLDITWSSGDASVAAVAADGTVKAAGKGTAVITAAAGSFTASCTVKVSASSSGEGGSDASHTAGISFDSTSMVLTEGKYGRLGVSFAPLDTVDSRDITWRSDNTRCVKVNNGLVTAVKAGTATVTAVVNAVEDGNRVKRTAACTVTVEKLEVPKPAAGDKSWKIGISRKSISMKTGGRSVVLKATVRGTKTVTWSSSDTDVVTVRDTSADGKYSADVAPAGAGTAFIIVSAADSSTGAVNTQVCRVNVTKPVSGIAISSDNTEGAVTELSLDPGELSVLKAVLTPGDTTDAAKVRWSSNSGAVKVKNGVLTAVKATKSGHPAVITASIGRYKAVVKVTVSNRITFIRLSRTELSLKKGRSAGLRAVTVPKTRVTWSAADGSDEDITVTRGGTVKVSRKASIGDKAVIVATATGDNTISANCVVTVIQ